MLRHMCKSKIHRATITGARLDYEGSIAVDKILLEAADIRPYEMVHVFNIHNGHRFQTYAIPAKKGSGIVELNGAAARLGARGDKAIILSAAWLSAKAAARHVPKIVFVNEKNQMVSHRSHGLSPRRKILS